MKMSHCVISIEAATYDSWFDLEEFTESVIGYIDKCIDDVTAVKTLKHCTNETPWMCADVWVLLRVRDTAFKLGDSAAHRLDRWNLSHLLQNVLY